MSVKNFVQCGLVTPVTTTAAELVLQAPTLSYQYPPLDGGTLVIADSVARPTFYEVISYTHRIDNVLYGVVRGKENTTARAWTGATWIYQALTAQDYVDALGTKAPLVSPALSGVPTAPTAAVGTNTNQIATMAAVQAAIAKVLDSSPAALDTLNELAAALGDDPNFAATINAQLAGKEPTIAAGTTAQYWAGNKTWQSLLSAVQGTLLTGLGAGSNTAIVTTDTLLGALAKLQNQINNKAASSDSRLTDSREWTAATVDQAEAEAGTATTRRAWTAQRVAQAARGVILTGLNLTLGTAVTASDTALVAIGKLQKQITDAASSLAGNVRTTVLTGYTLGSNAAVAATDTVIGAIGKLQAQVNSKLNADANAVSASKLATARNVQISGDVSGEAFFDGSGDINIPLVYKNSGVTPGTHTKVTVDAKGNVTAGASLAEADIPELSIAKITSLQTAINLASGLSASGSTSDPNTATTQVMLTNHANSPGLGRYWHITTTFYSSISSTGNRAQIAIEYNSSGICRAFVRSCYNGTWTAWNAIDNSSLTASDIPALDAAKITTGVLDAARIPTLNQDTTGNAATATKLASIGTSFSGTYPMVINASGVLYSHANVTFTGTSGVLAAPSFSGNGALLTALNASALATGTIDAARIPVLNQNTTGSAATLTTARTINGTSFNGGANITTSLWGTTRTLSFTGDVTGSAGVNGGSNVAFAMTLADSGVVAGEYTKITVDAKGRVTLGGSLAATDIPALDASKITTGTISASRLPSEALIGDTTYSAGTGLALNGTTFSLDKPIFPTGLSAVSTSASDVSGLGGFSVHYLSSSATNKPVGTDHALLTMAYNSSYMFQLAGDWRTNKLYTQTKNNGVLSGWKELLTTDGNGSALTDLNASNISSGTIAAARVPTLNQSTTGNAATATRLQTARTINGVSFNGTANITVADATKLPLAGGTMTGAITFAAGQTWPTFNQSTTGNAGTATALATARTLTIGGTGKLFDGSVNVTWTLGEIGAAPASHTHDYLPLSGGTVTGAVTLSDATDATSATTGALQVAGGVGVGGSVYAAGNVTSYSDIRLKKNIEVIENALDKVDQLRGVVFDRVDMDLRQTGVIAQEVQAVLPEAVTEDDFLGVSYGNMVGLLIEAIKELRAEVNELKERV